MADAKHDDHSAKKDEKKNSFIKTGLGKVFWGLIVAAGVGMALLALFSASDTGTAPGSVAGTVDPINMASQGAIVRSITDADCGKIVTVTLRFGERMTRYTPSCGMPNQDVRDGAVDLYYENGQKLTVQANGRIPSSPSSVSVVTGRSNIPAVYEFKLAPRSGRS